MSYPRDKGQLGVHQPRSQQLQGHVLASSREVVLQKSCEILSTCLSSLGLPVPTFTSHGLVQVDLGSVRMDAFIIWGRELILRKKFINQIFQSQ